MRVYNRFPFENAAYKTSPETMGTFSSSLGFKSQNFPRHYDYSSTVMKEGKENNHSADI